jgi:hypothetical protein
LEAWGEGAFGVRDGRQRGQTEHSDERTRERTQA